MCSTYVTLHSVALNCIALRFISCTENYNTFSSINFHYTTLHCCEHCIHTIYIPVHAFHSIPFPSLTFHFNSFRYIAFHFIVYHTTLHNIGCKIPYAIYRSLHYITLPYTTRDVCHWNALLWNKRGSFIWLLTRFDKIDFWPFFLCPSIHAIFYIQSSALANKNHPHLHRTLWSLWCKLGGLVENTVECIFVRFIHLESWHQHQHKRNSKPPLSAVSFFRIDQCLHLVPHASYRVPRRPVERFVVINPSGCSPL